MAALLAALMAALMGLGVVQAGAVPASAQETPPAPTETTAAPAPAPEPPAPAPTLEQIFPGIPPGTTAEQLELFFKLLAGPPVPANTGLGRRIVYSNSAQRVWLVEGDESVVRTYAVSGRTGAPKPGVYRIFSKSRYTTSGSARMEYMVRFARGRSMAIGFHTIPTRANGTPLQSMAQLGTPLSHGCVRQGRDDAILLYLWAPVGTAVVVLP